MTTAHPAALTAPFVGGASTEPAASPVRARGTALVWLGGLRALVAMALLAPLAAYTAGQGHLTAAAWLAVLPGVCLVSGVVGLLYGERAPQTLVAAQSAVDVLVAIAAVWSTGGLTSAYTPLTLLPVFAAAVMRGRVAGLRAAAAVGIGFGFMTAVQAGWLPAPALLLQPLTRAGAPLAPLAAYTLAANIGGNVAIALLVGQLSESLSRTGADLARATHTLADLTTLSQRVIDSMTGGLIVADAQGHIVLFNRTAEVITGVRADEALGQPFSRVWPLAQSVPADSMVPTRLECTFTRHDGTVIEVGATVAPLLSSGGQRAGQLVTFQDLTEINQKEAERQRQARLAAVGEMAAGIAHEIRNPLASMGGSIQLLSQELDLQDHHRQLLDIVLRESQRLENIIRNFLSYAGPQRVTRANVNVGALVRDVGALLEQQVRGLDPAVWITVEAPDEVLHDLDEAQIRQVLWNLATNGIKAMPRGGELRLTVTPDEGGVLRLGVSDTGVGMGPADVERMFQPFQSGFRQGTGLGLAIVRRIVTDHGGRVAVRSAPGQGTEITVELPAA